MSPVLTEDPSGRAKSLLVRELLFAILIEAQWGWMGEAVDLPERGLETHAFLGCRLIIPVVKLYLSKLNAKKICLLLLSRILDISCPLDSGAQLAVIPRYQPVH